MLKIDPASAGKLFILSLELIFGILSELPPDGPATPPSSSLIPPALNGIVVIFESSENCNDATSLLFELGVIDSD